MKRWALHLIFWPSLVLSLMALALLLMSYQRFQHASMAKGGGTGWIATVQRGTVFIAYARPYPGDVPFRWDMSGKGPPHALRMNGPFRQRQWPGLIISSGRGELWMGVGSHRTGAGSPVSLVLMQLSMWVIPLIIGLPALVLGGVSLTVQIRGWLRARARSRLQRCPTCGYDLRATPDRCPECGTAKV